MDSEELVRAYIKTRDPKLRELAIIQFLPVVKYVIGRMHLSVNNKTELDDIHSAGVLGIIHALDSYDISKNTMFKTYATWRVQGFILDYLRKIDFVSRTDRAKIRDLERVTAELTRKYGRAPTDLELADRLDIAIGEVHRLFELTQVNFKATFDQKQSINGEEVTLGDLIADDAYEDPFESVSKKDLFALVKETIGNLPERMRVIVIMYYYEEMTLAEIGKVLSLSESRVSRLLGKALITIRKDIHALKGEESIPI